MKKILLFASALAGLFLAGSCQRENLEPMESANTVTYTVQVPGALSTKTIGEDVAAVTELVYEVYRTEATSADDHTKAETKLFHKTATITNGTATVEFELVNNQNFRVLFWAQVPNNGVYTVTDLKNVTISQALNANAENYAAFAGADYIKAGESIVGRTLPLVRPIAQLNIGTDDASLDIEGQTDVEISTTAVTVNGLSTSFNVAENKAGEISAADYVYAAKPVAQTTEYPGLSESTFAVNGTNYNYVAMNYVGFAPQMGTNVEVTYTINTENVGTITNTIDNVPVKANHRTNIIGNLITSMSDYTITLDKEWEDAEYTHAMDVTAAQAALDAAADGAIIKLEPGVNYGTLVIRPVEGQKNTIVDCDYLVYRNEMLRKVENLTIVGAPGATVDAIAFVSGHIEGSTGYVVDIKNLVIDSVEFTDKHTNAPHKYAAPIFIDLSYINVDGLTVNNCKLVGNNDKMNLVYLYSSGKVAFDNLAKNITITNNTVDGIARLCELRQTENVTITGNTIKNTYLHGMLLPVSEGTYSGNVTITDNTATGINDRFVRMAGAGDAVVVIKDNIINNYLGAEDDYIKVTDGTNVTIENNVCTRFVAEGVGLDFDGNYVVTAEAGLEWVADEVIAGNTFDGKTIILANDIDFGDSKFYAIGYNPKDNSVKEFKGTFDGNNKTIKNLKNTDLTYANKRAIGLFAKVENAVIKNLTLEEFVAATYGGEAAAVACVATGVCSFENIKLTSGSIVAYNNDTAGIVGWANVGNFTFKNIDIAADVTVFSLWDSYDTSLGGVIGTLESGSTAVFEDINVACKLDAYNDVCSNYQWSAYRRTGMLIGNMAETQTINGTTYPDPKAAGVSCTNVHVTYGDWMNYHYCEFKSNGHGSYDDEFTWKCSRVEGSEWGSDGVDITQCEHESFESHNMCLPVDQLFGGGQGVYGLRKYNGVSVHYPSSYVYVEETVVADEVSEITGGETTGVIDEGYLINMTTDITASAKDTDANSGYGATGVKVNGGVLDGQGNTLTITDANGTWDCAVNVSGGTIKNLTVAGAMRGIFMGGANADVYIDNVIFEDVIYTFNSDGGNKNYGVYISNSTVKGWTSHSDVHKEVVYTNCTFTVGNGYAKCRPYGPTTYRNCDFDVANGSHVEAIGNVVFENCTLNGAALTTENLSTLVTSNIANATVK